MRQSCGGRCEDGRNAVKAVRGWQCCAGEGGCASKRGAVEGHHQGCGGEWVGSMWRLGVGVYEGLGGLYMWRLGGCMWR